MTMLATRKTKRIEDYHPNTIRSWTDVLNEVDKFCLKCQPNKGERLESIGSLFFPYNSRTIAIVEARVSQVIKADRSYGPKVLFYIQGRRVSKDYIVSLLA